MPAMLTSAQIRAARAFLNWSARELAKRAGVSERTILRAERTEGTPRLHTNTMDAIQLALEQGGVVFLDANQHFGPGLRLRRP